MNWIAAGCAGVAAAALIWIGVPVWVVIPVGLGAGVVLAQRRDT